MEANIINDNFVHDSNYKRIYIKQNMDYEEKYKKTLEKARKELQACGSVDCDAAKQIFRFFPELAESEDEKIKKWIKKELESKYVVDNIVNNEMADKALAWLEKQGEKNPSWSREDEQNLNVVLSFIADEYLRRWLKDVIHVKYDKTDNKVEPKFHEGDIVRHKNIEGFECTIESIDDLTYYGNTTNFDIKDQNNWKLVEQKPTDMVEPKFHEGEWTVSNLDGKARQISEVHFDEYNSYYVVDGKSVNLEEYDRLHHLWTIADAKDGDVLANNNGWVGVFKFLYSDDFTVYYFITRNMSFYSEFCVYDTLDPLFYHIHPATKEQRDTLFAKMKEAGYEWDANKKELKNIEKKITDKMESKFHEGDWVVVSTTKGDRVVQIASVEYFKDAYPSYITTEGRWFGNGTKARLLTDKDMETITLSESRVIVNHKPAEWSEEDKKMFVNIKACLRNANKDYSTELDWLKSLKPQKQWKPNDEQMNALNDVISSRDIKYDVLSELWKDLKKLRKK